jgi:hypothetical protein
LGLKKIAPASIVILALLLSVTMGAVIINVALADPVPDWVVHLNSPENNKIYSSNSVKIELICTLSLMDIIILIALMGKQPNLPMEAQF